MSLEGLQIYESYRDSFDALVNETRLLRAELIEGCRAFGGTMSKVEDDEIRCEAFKLYLRDIHAAHEELTNRLSKLRDDAVRDEIAKRQKEIDALNEQVRQLRKTEECAASKNGEITSLKKEKDSLNEKLTKLENQVRQRQQTEKNVEKEISDKMDDIVGRLCGLEMMLKQRIGKASKCYIVSSAIGELKKEELYNKVKEISSLVRGVRKTATKLVRGWNEMP